MMEFSAVNTIWVLLGAALVFFMQAGFAMVETGFTRAKNAGNIIMKNLMDFAIGTPLFWLTQALASCSRMGLLLEVLIRWCGEIIPESFRPASPFPPI